MLVLSLHQSNQIRIGNDIVIRLAHGMKQARICLDVPKEIQITREKNSLFQERLNNANSR